MSRAFLDLPSHVRARLAGALETRLIDLTASPALLRTSFELEDSGEALAGALTQMQRDGLTAAAVAKWIRSLDEALSRVPVPSLVWTGPEVEGLHARDTRRVYEELLGSATKSLWASTFVFFDGPRAFDILARRMEAVPALQVTLILNIQRKWGDTTAADSLVRRFADDFWGRDWPGKTRPRVFYFPPSLSVDGPSAVLHAKAVVADEEAVFITSANLTDAALDRNIEIGVLLRDRMLATNVVRHFRGLVDRCILRPLPMK